MDKNRLWIAGAVLVVGLVIMAGWMLGISPQLGQTRVAKSERVAVEAQNEVYELQLVSLGKQFAGIGALRKELAALRQAVPSGADIPLFVGELSTIAQEHQVAMTAMSVSDALPPAVVEDPPATDAPSTDAPATGTPTPSAVPTPTATSPVTAESFIAVPISFTVEGGYDNVLDFVDGVQQGKRLMTITNFTTAASTTPGLVEGIVSGLVYVLLDPSESPED